MTSEDEFLSSSIPQLPIVENSKEGLASALHSKGRDYINHFSKIKLRYKKLTITWVTAISIALAYTMSSEEHSVHVNKLYLISLITALALIGIKLLWYLDVNVYHKQMSALFKGLTLLEERYPEMIQPYLKMAKALHKKYFDPILIDSLYYGVISIFIALMGTVALYLKFRAHHPLSSILLSLSIIMFFLIFEFLTLGYAIHLGGSRFDREVPSEIQNWPKNKDTSK